MTQFDRRGFLTGAAAIAAATATMGGGRQAFGGDPSFMNNVPDPLLAGKELPTFKFALEKSEGKVIGKSYGKEATVEQLPISKGIAGVSMGLEPGAMRELHWHATAAEWAFVDKGRVRTTVIAPGRVRGDERLRAGGRVVLPARPRPHARMPGRRAVPLHPDLRQRLLLRVRHVQHHRLDRPHPQAAVGEELRPSRIGLRRVPEERGVLRPRGAAAGEAGGPAQGMEAAAADAQVSTPRQSAARQQQGRPAVAGRFHQVSDLQDDYRRDPRPRPGGAAGTALAPDGRRVAVRPRGEGQRDAVRLAAAATGPRRWRRATSATSRKGTGTRSRTSATSRAASSSGSTPAIYEEIDLSQWIAANPPDVLATNFGKPAALFEKFPHKDVFIADKDGK